MPAPNFSRPKLVVMIDCRREKCGPSLPAPGNAFSGVDDVKGHLRIKLFLWTPVGDTPFLRFRRACCHRCRCRLGNGGTVFSREFGSRPLPCRLVAERAQFREKTACCHVVCIFHVKTTTTHPSTIQSADHSIKPWLVADKYQVRTWRDTTYLQKKSKISRIG